MPGKELCTTISRLVIQESRDRECFVGSARPDTCVFHVRVFSPRYTRCISYLSHTSVGRSITQRNAISLRDERVSLFPLFYRLPPAATTPIVCGKFHGSPQILTFVKILSRSASGNVCSFFGQFVST